MKQPIQKSTNLDQMLLSLVSEGAARYELFTKDISELQDDNINELFELTLDVLGDNKRGEMNQLPKEKKYHLIKQLLSNQERVPLRENNKSPAYYSDSLTNSISPTAPGIKGRTEQLLTLAKKLGGNSRQQPTLRTLILELKVQCQCQTLSWLKEFIHSGGLNSLFIVLESMHSKPGRRNKHFEIECETLKILRLIANSEPALAQMLLEQSRLNILIQSLDSPSLMARTATIDFFLIIVTVDYPTGHKLVLEAMEFFRSIRNKKRVFDYLIEALGNAVGARGIFGTFVGATPTTSTTTELSQVFRFGTEKVGKPTEKHMREYLVSCVAFIRFIVEIPPEFEYRMHIRQELISSGLQPVFQKLKTWAPSEFQDILQHVAAFESLKMADFKYLLGNLGVEMDVDLSDSNQLLNLLVSRLDTQDKTTVSSLIQNIVVGTALIDNETRSYMLSMIEKVVMYIVLDQNGITEFTDAFKYSVDQIIAGLQEIEALQVENEQLTAICEHQEKQLLSSSNTLTELENTSQVLDISSAALVQHRDKLKLIYQALEKLPSEIAQTLKGISDTPDLAKVGNDNDEKDQKEEKPAISPQDSSTTISYQATIDSGTNISKPPPPIPVSAGTGAPPPPSIPPPPPPVAAPVISIPLKYKPKTKTRKIHWERVNTTGYEESTWAKFKTYSETEEKLYKSGLLSELDTLFEAVPSAIKKESSKPKEEKEFLSADRIKNAMIFLGSLKDISVDSLIESIRIFDVSKLTDNQLNECYKFYPKDDEQKLIASQRSGIKFGKAEQFVMAAILASLNGLQSITKSQRFKSILEILLVLGNYMNASYGTIKGFKVSFLSKILEVKSGDTGLVLLLARMILKDDEQMALFIQDFKPLTENKKFSTATILEDLADFERNVNLVQKEVEASKSYHESPSYHRKDALFLKGALQFSSELSAKLEFIKRENDALFEEVRKVLHFFGEPKDSKTTIETVVEHIIKFASYFEAAIIQIREEERKNAAKAKQLLPASASKPVTKPKINPTNTEQARHLDNLLENLKNKPALDSFELLQRPKHRDAFGSEQRRFPRNNIHTPKLIPNTSKVGTPVNSLAEETWKLLDSIDVGGLELNFE